MDKHLHIVCHDIPWPVDHGGYVDLFYKIKALYKFGVKIHLHCFYSRRNKAEELIKYCYSVDYYKRNKFALSLKLPYIVNSRKSKSLFQNIQNDNYPLLLEGIHCTYELFRNNLNNRIVLVRLHNVEFLYYLSLAKCEPNYLKRIYFKTESLLLKKYERKLANKALFVTVSEKDKEVYINQFNASQVEFMPVFIAQNKTSSKPGKGEYCLYHGNLEVNENEVAAMWLIKNVFNNNKIQFVIAGRNPSITLRKEVEKYDTIKLIINPSSEKMSSLVEDAHINILPSFNNTGVKLKIINALFKGRFCLVNSTAIEDSNLKNLCSIADTPNEINNQLLELLNKNFSQNMIEEREVELNKLYKNYANVEKLISLLFPNYQ